MRIAYISTKDNVADILTKTTTRTIFNFLKPKLMGIQRALRASLSTLGRGGASDLSSS